MSSCGKAFVTLFHMFSSKPVDYLWAHVMPPLKPILPSAHPSQGDSLKQKLRSWDSFLQLVNWVHKKEEKVPVLWWAWQFCCRQLLFPSCCFPLILHSTPRWKLHLFRGKGHASLTLLALESGCAQSRGQCSEFPLHQHPNWPRACTWGGWTQNNPFWHSTFVGEAERFTYLNWVW